MSYYGNSMIHQDQVLANVALAFKQSPDRFVAGSIFPEVNVTKQSAEYYIWDKDAFLRSFASERAPGSEVTMRNMKLSTDTYSCQQKAIGDFITIEDDTNQDAAVQLRASTVEGIMADMMIKRDVDFLSAYTSTGVWDTDLSGVASTSPGSTEFTQWDQYSHSDPIKDVREAKRDVLLKTGIEPNVALVDKKTYDAFASHPIFRQPSAGFATRRPSRQEIADLLEVDDLIVSSAVQVTSTPGATRTTSFLMDKKMLLVYRPPAPGIRVAASGMIFNWTGLFGGIGAETDGIVVRSLPQDKKLREDIEAFMAYDFKVTGSELGVLFDATVS